MEEFNNLENPQNPENENMVSKNAEQSAENSNPTPEEPVQVQGQPENKGNFTVNNNGWTPPNTQAFRQAPPPPPPSYTPQFNSYYAPPQKPKKPKEKSNFSLITVIISVVLAAVVGLGGGIVGTLAVYKAYSNGTTNSQTPNNNNSGDVTINVEDVDASLGEAIAEKVTPSVVGIRTTVSVTNFFGGTQEASGEGSGVIYTEDGYIITNYHVIGDAIDYGRSSEIEVFLSGDTENGYTATVVGYNISNDLAVIKINATNLNAIEWADSGSLKVGQQVMAIGNPGGLEFMGSATWGIISGLNRVISSGSDGSTTQLIQTDAAINPGNSGGALVNIEGKLIGINSSKLVSESVEGMGFAIPSNTVKEICDKIIAKENNPDPYIGITISTRYDPETLKNWNYPVGAVVYSVAVDSPAADAGIQKGDIITEFAGKKITHYNLLGDYLKECKPGDVVTVQVYRSGRYIEGNITIGSNNSQ
ncbi:MAG: trypsin-like peptidase domain-containing protein [Clostridia bacterium]|nr:trypsin-like peptidase domain-containing protein [Clostridia bacterium]